VIEFGNKSFLYAGLGLAALSVWLHLVPRRRVRVIDWGAMQLLARAYAGRRRAVRLRDTALLALRVLAVLCISLAAARTTLREARVAVPRNRPVAAAILLDNSLSMGWRGPAGTLLQQAQHQIAAYVSHLPTGSQVAVVPLCSRDTQPAAFVAPAEARRALDMLQVADQSAGPAEIRRALARLPPHPLGRYLTASLWTDAQLGVRDADLPAAWRHRLAVVRVGPAQADNVWIERLEFPDGVVEPGGEAPILAEVRCTGRARRVQATLLVDGDVVAVQPMEVHPDRPGVTVFVHRWDVRSPEGSLDRSRVELRLPPDSLPMDNQCTLLVPLVANALIVVVQGESPARAAAPTAAYSKGAAVLKWLFAAPDGEDAKSALVQVRVVSPAELTSQVLADAALVILAGTVLLPEQVGELTEYVKRGGHLWYVAASDPSSLFALKTKAWRSLLPAVPRLAVWPQPAAAFPGPTTGAAVEPPVPAPPDQVPPVPAPPSDRRGKPLAARMPNQRGAMAAPPRSDVGQTQPAQQRRQPARLDMKTLDPALFSFAGWSAADADDLWSEVAVDRVLRVEPIHLHAQVHARLETGEPLLLSRTIGQGQVWLWTTTLDDAWNNVCRTRGVLLYDRLVRKAVAARWPVLAAQAGTTLEWQPPEGVLVAQVAVRGMRTAQPRMVASNDGVRWRIPAPRQRGLYWLDAFASSTSRSPPVWSEVLAVSGPTQESALVPLDNPLRRPSTRAQGRVVETTPAELLSAGRPLYPWLLIVALAVLAAEQLLRLAPASRGSAPLVTVSEIISPSELPTGARAASLPLLLAAPGRSTIAVSLDWQSPWGGCWPLALCLAIVVGVLVALVHVRVHRGCCRRRKWLLAAARAAAAAGCVTLALDPVLRLERRYATPPHIVVLCDATASMTLEDEPQPEGLGQDQRRGAGSQGADPSVPGSSAPNSKLDAGGEKAHESAAAAGGGSFRAGRMRRVDAAQRLLASGPDALLPRLQRRFEVSIYSFGQGGRLQRLDPASPVWQAEGSDTQLGAALEGLERLPEFAWATAVIILSDFDQNAGPSPAAVARRLGLPLYTVGFGRAAVAEPPRAETVLPSSRPLRVLWVEYEPSWEWRFAVRALSRGKEAVRVRSYVRSADARLREAEPRWLPSLALPRAELLDQDVVVLGDVPRSMLTSHFTTLLRELVLRFGGGLVLACGPRFGPSHLADTSLADLLPVQVEPGSRRADVAAYAPRFEAAANDYAFCAPWKEAQQGPAPPQFEWYHPLVAAGRDAHVLAVHPDARTARNGQPLPLMAAGRAGRGRVVFLGTAESWRLRRASPELHARFWSSLIRWAAEERVNGLAGRMTLRADRAEISAGQAVTLFVEAYDAKFQPLGSNEAGELCLELLPPSGPPVPLRPACQQPGSFTARLVLPAAGEYLVRAHDAATGSHVSLALRAWATSPERRGMPRRQDLQDELARRTGGRSYTRAEAARLSDDLPRTGRRHIQVREWALAEQWPVYLVLMALLFWDWKRRG